MSWYCPVVLVWTCGWMDRSTSLWSIVSVTSTVHVRRSYLSIYQWYMSMYSTYSTSGRREGGRDGGMEGVVDHLFDHLLWAMSCRVPRKHEELMNLYHPWHLFHYRYLVNTHIVWAK
jgi:hypothetical protein